MKNTFKVLIQNPPHKNRSLSLRDYWKRSSRKRVASILYISSKEEWIRKAIDCAELAKLTAKMRESNDDCFVEERKPFLNYLRKYYNLMNSLIKVLLPVVWEEQGAHKTRSHATCM